MKLYKLWGFIVIKIRKFFCCLSFVVLSLGSGSLVFSLTSSLNSSVAVETVKSKEENNSDTDFKGAKGALLSIDNDKKTYHLCLCKNDIEGATYAILPGDPGRVKLIASYLENSKQIAQNREYTSYLGTCNGKKVLVTSTGIGGPSTAIAIEELAMLGVQNLIRVGTSGGMQMNVNAGDLVIAQAAVRQEGTSREYVPIEIPAVADLDLTLALRNSALKFGKTCHVGIVHCKDSFYGQHSPECMPVSSDLLNMWKACISSGVLCSEMETASLYTIARCRGIRAAAILLVVWNQEQEKAGVSQDTSFDCDSAIKVTIDAIHSLIAQDQKSCKS